MEQVRLAADPKNRESEYTPDLNFYEPDLHDLNEGSESLDESLRMKEQPFMGEGATAAEDESQ
jgi:hypothetical protein